MEKWSDVRIEGNDIRKARKAKAASGQCSWRLHSGVFGAAVLVFGACCGVPTSPVAAVAADQAPRQAPVPTAEGPESGGTIEPQVCRELHPAAYLLRRPGHVDQRRRGPHGHPHLVAAERGALHVPGHL